MSGKESVQFYADKIATDGTVTLTATSITLGDPVADAVAAMLQGLGVDEGDHTSGTPERAAKAWRHMLAGYQEDPRQHLHKQFSAPLVPGLVIASGIRMNSTCAHHLLPITGTATVAYRPKQGQNVVGLSKLNRLLEGYARRLQVQERIGAQVVDAIQGVLDPVGSACIISAEHGCMTLRGVEDPCGATTTVATSGDWDTGKPDVGMAYDRHNAER